MRSALALSEPLRYRVPKPCRFKSPFTKIKKCNYLAQTALSVAIADHQGANIRPKPREEKGELLEAMSESSEPREYKQHDTGGIEVDSIEVDTYRIWAGMDLLGTMRCTQAGWIAYPFSGKPSRHSTPDQAQQAVVEMALPY